MIDNEVAERLTAFFQKIRGDTHDFTAATDKYRLVCLNT